MSPLGRRSRPRRRSTPRKNINEIIANTGKTARQWARDLDGLEADKMTHMEAVNLLVEKFGLSAYQAQVLVHYYRKKIT